LHIGFFRNICRDKKAIPTNRLNLANGFFAFSLPTTCNNDVCSSLSQCVDAKRLVGDIALALPIPDVPPVTSATFQDNVVIIKLLFV
jgi:hypothetical protein